MSEHDFQWRRGLRDLSGPVQPQRDLWLDIATRIQAEAPPATANSAAPRRRRVVAWALAASVALAAVLAGTLQLQQPVAPPQAATQVKSDPAAAIAAVDRQFKQVRTQDPRLAAASVELDAAADEIRQMLQQQPDAVFLVGLLNRTNERRLKLARMGQASS